MLCGCLGLSGLSRAEHDRLDAFDFYWQALATSYPLFGQHQVPWQELRQRYRAAVPYAQRPHEFYHLLTGMFSELGDVHVSFAAPPERWLDDGKAPTSLLDLDGFRLMPIEGRLHVVGWPEGQAPPQPDGLPPEAIYPELWRVEGFPVVVSLVTNLLHGPPGSEVELQLRWREGIVTRHVLHRPATGGSSDRRSPLGHLDSGFWRWRLHHDRPFGWLEVATFDDQLDVDNVARVIDKLRPKGGLVLDLRRNLGGRWNITREIVEHSCASRSTWCSCSPWTIPRSAG